MNSTDKKQTNQLNSVDQIRDILFGDQVKRIENRFSELEKSLTITIEALANKVEQGNSDLNQLIKNSNKQLQSDADQLANQQSQDFKDLESTLSSQLIETESELNNQIQSGLEKLENKASHRGDLAQLLRDMANALDD